MKLLIVDDSNIIRSHTARIALHSRLRNINHAVRQLSRLCLFFCASSSGARASDPVAGAGHLRRQFAGYGR
jgi:hypothetical protein